MKNDRVAENSMKRARDLEGTALVIEHHETTGDGGYERGPAGFIREDEVTYE